MFNHTITALSIAAALGLATTGVLAQSATTTKPVTSVGVTPQDAQEATQKATPRSDTGTLVRTEPSAAERARDMTNDGKNSEKPKKSISQKSTSQKTPPPKNSSGERAKSAPPVSDPKSQTTTGTVTNTTTPGMAMGITGTVPGADDTTGDATNTRDNAKKGDAAKPSGTGKSVDAMGNHKSSDTKSKP